MAMTETSLEALQAQKPAGFPWVESLDPVKPLDQKFQEGIGVFGVPREQEVEEIAQRLHEAFEGAQLDSIDSKEYGLVIAYCIFSDFSSVRATRELEKRLFDIAADRESVRTEEPGHPSLQEVWSGSDSSRLYRVRRHIGPLAFQGPSVQEPVKIVDNALTYNFQSMRIPSKSVPLSSRF